MKRARTYRRDPRATSGEILARPFFTQRLTNKAGSHEQEIVGVQWLTPEEIRQRRAEHRSPLVQKCVDDFLAGRSFPLDVFSPEFS